MKIVLKTSEKGIGSKVVCKKKAQSKWGKKLQKQAIPQWNSLFLLVRVTGVEPA
mgnify:CR=1